MLEQEYRSLQRLMEIAELRQKGIQDTHLLDWNFRVAEDTPYVQMGKRYVNNWKQVKAENLGLLFGVMWAQASPFLPPASPTGFWIRVFLSG